jgi:hypothetical protein
MRRKSHVRFWIGGGESDLLADHTGDGYTVPHSFHSLHSAKISTEQQVLLNLCMGVYKYEQRK